MIFCNFSICCFFNYIFSYNSFDEYAFVGENEVFARAFFETEQANPSHRIKYLLNKFEKYTEGFKSEIIKSIIERENSFLSFDSFSKEVLSENPELYIKLLRESDGVLPYTDIKFTAFSQEQIDIIHEIKKDKEFRYLPTSLQMEDRFLAKALDEDFVKVVNGIN